MCNDPYDNNYDLYKFNICAYDQDDYEECQDDEIMYCNEDEITEIYYELIECFVVNQFKKETGLTIKLKPDKIVLKFVDEYNNELEYDERNLDLIIDKGFDYAYKHLVFIIQDMFDFDDWNNYYFLKEYLENNFANHFKISTHGDELLAEELEELKEAYKNVGMNIDSKELSPRPYLASYRSI